MGAVGKGGILICTKMQLSFAAGRRLRGSARGEPPPPRPPGGGYRGGAKGGGGGEGAGVSLRSAGRSGWRGGKARSHLRTGTSWSRQSRGAEED